MTTPVQEIKTILKNNKDEKNTNDINITKRDSIQIDIDINKKQPKSSSSRRSTVSIQVPHYQTMQDMRTQQRTVQVTKNNRRVSSQSLEPNTTENQRWPVNIYIEDEPKITPSRSAGIDSKDDITVVKKTNSNTDNNVNTNVNIQTTEEIPNQIKPIAYIGDNYLRTYHTTVIKQHRKSLSEKSHQNIIADTIEPSITRNTVITSSNGLGTHAKVVESDTKDGTVDNNDSCLKNDSIEDSPIPNKEDLSLTPSVEKCHDTDKEKENNTKRNTKNNDIMQKKPYYINRWGKIVFEDDPEWDPNNHTSIIQETNTESSKDKPYTLHINKRYDITNIQQPQKKESTSRYATVYSSSAFMNNIMYATDIEVNENISGLQSIYTKPMVSTNDVEINEKETLNTTNNSISISETKNTYYDETPTRNSTKKLSKIVSSIFRRKSKYSISDKDTTLSTPSVIEYTKSLKEKSTTNTMDSNTITRIKEEEYRYTTTVNSTRDDISSISNRTTNDKNVTPSLQIQVRSSKVDNTSIKDNDVIDINPIQGSRNSKTFSIDENFDTSNSITTTTICGDENKKNTNNTTIDISITKKSSDRDKSSINKSKQKILMDTIASHITREIEQKREKIWQDMYRNWNKIKNRNDIIKRRCRKGIPESLRGVFWPQMANINEYKINNPNLFDEQKIKPCDHDDIIMMDVIRTFPTHVLFLRTDITNNTGNNRGRNALVEVTRAYCNYDPIVKYCQGLSFIVGCQQMYLPPDETFWMLVSLLNSPKYNLREQYCSGFPGLLCMCYQLECIIQKLDKKLSNKQKDIGFEYNLIAPQWFLCLFTYNFPLPLAVRIWDIFIYEGPKILLRVAAILIISYRDKIISGDLMSVSDALCHQLPLDATIVGDIDELLNRAMSLNITRKQLDKYANIWKLRCQNRLKQQDDDNDKQEYIKNSIKRSSILPSNNKKQGISDKTVLPDDTDKIANTQTPTIQNTIISYGDIKQDKSTNDIQVTNAKSFQSTSNNDSLLRFSKSIQWSSGSTYQPIESEQPTELEQSIEHEKINTNIREESAMCIDTNKNPSSIIDIQKSEKITQRVSLSSSPSISGQNF